ncbi:MAG TPA: hypothetical protein VGP72_15995 [Planctomycetota bacterium]|jgi:hypothetical protein
MGYDVTFHPVSVEDLQHFLFDVVDDPSLSTPRSQEISEKDKARQLVKQLYEKVPEWFSDKSVPFNASVSFLAAILAGFRRPFWYSRGASLSFAADAVPEMGELFTPLPGIAKGSISKRADPSKGRITENYTASGIILPEKIEALQKLFPRIAPSLDANAKGYHFYSDDFRSLLVATNFARSNGLGLIEASDVVVPAADECISDFDNMRAPFLKRVDP